METARVKLYNSYKKITEYYSLVMRNENLTLISVK